MDYVSMWPKDLKKEFPPRSLPLGVYVSYHKDDNVELEHLIDFLYAHFNLSEKDFGATIDIDEPRFPLIWADMQVIPFKRLISEMRKGNRIKKRIDFGFRHEQQFTVLAYKVHLERDNKVDQDLRDLYADIEYDYFGTPFNRH